MRGGTVSLAGLELCKSDGSTGSRTFRGLVVRCTTARKALASASVANRETPTGRVSQFKRAETNAFDTHDAMAQGFEHALDLMFSAFVNRQFQPGIGFGLCRIF